jgi:hypothetical protein
MAALSALALLALGKNGSPVKPVYTRAYLLKAVVTLSNHPTAMVVPMVSGWTKGRMGRGKYDGAARRNAVRRARRRRDVRISADRTIVPRDEVVERVRAAWIV